MFGVLRHMFSGKLHYIGCSYVVWGVGVCLCRFHGIDLLACTFFLCVFRVGNLSANSYQFLNIILGFFCYLRLIFGYI